LAKPSNEEIVRHYLQALGALRDPEWSWEWPQSGERIRGNANERAMADHWPGGVPSPELLRVVGSEDRWFVTPFNTVHRVVGSGDFWWADGTTTYPDGSTWFIAALLELKGDKIHRETWYFAPPFEAPAWRAPWVERMS
jgi:hypothetical protein